jgi:hypothetical protein
MQMYKVLKKLISMPKVYQIALTEPISSYADFSSAEEIKAKAGIWIEAQKKGFAQKNNFRLNLFEYL